MKKRRDRTNLAFFSMRNANKGMITRIRKLADEMGVSVEECVNMAWEVGVPPLEENEKAKRENERRRMRQQVENGKREGFQEVEVAENACPVCKGTKMYWNATWKENEVCEECKGTGVRDQ